MADSSKTEKATPKKRRDERKKGNIFFSNDAVSVAVLAASFAVIRLLGPMAAGELEGFLRLCLSYAAAVEEESLTGQLSGLLVQFLRTFALTAGPVAAALALYELGQMEYPKEGGTGA